MLITPYNPFREIRELENRLFGRHNIQKTEQGVSAFTPSVNTREGEYAYHVDVDLPGVKKEDINIDLKDNILTISGERNFKEEVKEEDYYKVETSFGKFSRSFTLPEDADVENINASSDAGVLEVVIPKLAKPKNITRIEIK
ncbi:MAG: Hsp20/alpha crystallin family protein [Campylobacterales bacterium]|nr:Hsp20/alpha crystallin family protein [Campylobacterales bacterium]